MFDHRQQENEEKKALGEGDGGKGQFDLEQFRRDLRKDPRKAKAAVWSGGRGIAEDQFLAFSTFIAHPWWFNHRKVEVQTTSEYTVCEEWIAAFRESGADALGLDIEWKANTARNQKPEPVATLQLATEHSCLVVQTLYCKPDECKALRDLLSDGRVMKLGVGIKQDFNKLARDCNLHCVGGLDLSKYFKSTYKIMIKEDIGLKRLAKFILAFDLDKPKSLSRSDWSAARLKESQIKYAALDAVVACKVFQRLRSANSFEQLVISTRTNFYLQRSFASRRVKRSPAWARLFVFGALLFLLWAPCLVITSKFKFLELQLHKDLVRISWAVICLMSLIRSWGEEMYKWRKPIQTYTGTSSSTLNWKAFSQGLATGLSVVTLFYSVLWFYGLGFVVLGNVSGKVALHAVGVGLTVGLVEEILFRGFMQKELERDFKGDKRWKANFTLAFIFAAMHLSAKSFCGLILLSLCLSQGRRVYSGDLSFSIGLHSSLVATNMLFNGNAFVPSAAPAAPLWFTGYSAHGPHSGLLGMGILLVLYLFLSTKGGLSSNKSKVTAGKAS